MAIEWLAGNRLRGTTAERPALGLQSPSVGGWVEVGRTTLSGASTTIDVSSIPDKRYYMVLMDYTQTSDFSGLHRLGNSSIDTGNNYNNRQSSNGGSDSTGQATWVRVDNGWQSGDRKLAVEYIANKSDKEKLIMNHMARSVTTGASQAPQRSEVVSKWANTSNVLDKFQMMNVSSGNFASGSEVVVLGWDPSDSHTTNFWEELATHTQSSSGEATISFTAKKYIWIQYEITALNPSATGLSIRFNSDSGSNYARRFSQEGGSDSTNTSQDKLSMIHSGGSNFFANMFIINNASNEKLIIAHQVAKTSASGGASEVPRRWEITGKWTNTSDQISSLTFIDTEQGSSGISKGTIKVWGAD